MYIKNTANSKIISQISKKRSINNSYEHRIIIAMSGGIDSSVSAWLLKKMGYNLIGVALNLTNNSCKTSKIKNCCSLTDLHDAKSTCLSIKISFYIINEKNRFKKHVFNPFIQMYAQGMTPTPCVYCNNKIKFNYLYKIAKRLKANIATGHYAKIVNFNGFKSISKSNNILKDQSYYLYGIDKKIINNLILPIGKLDKNIIRKIAKKIKLKIFNKSDSQEICFVPNNNYKLLFKGIQKSFTLGNLINKKGIILGGHNGIYQFTIGQRRGIKIGFGEKIYIVDINPDNKNIVLGLEKDLFCSKIRINQLILRIPLYLWPKNIYLKVKATSNPIKTKYYVKKRTIDLLFHTGKQAVAIGQSAVIYHNNIVLCGGTIKGRLNGIYPRLKSCKPKFNHS